MSHLIKHIGTLRYNYYWRFITSQLSYIDQVIGNIHKTDDNFYLIELDNMNKDHFTQLEHCVTDYYSFNNYRIISSIVCVNNKTYLKCLVNQKILNLFEKYKNKKCKIIFNKILKDQNNADRTINLTIDVKDIQFISNITEKLDKNTVIFDI